MKHPILQSMLALFVVIGFGKIADGQAQNGGPHFYRQAHVLGIGIDDYESSGIPDLQQAEDDASRIVNCLRDRYGFTPTTLLGQAASKRGIYNAIDGFQAKLGRDDVLIVYFACHGKVFDYVGDSEGDLEHRRVGYLLPQDATLNEAITNNADDWQREAISMRNLVDRIKRIPAQHVLLIADTCCSGFLTKRGGTNAIELHRLVAGDSRTVLAATTQNESAREGVFTPRLIAILDQYGKNAMAFTVTDLLQKILPAVARSPRGRMTPQMAHVGDGDGELLFLPVKISSTEIGELRKNVDRVRESSNGGKEKLVAVPLAQLGILRGVAGRIQDRAGQRTTLQELLATSVAPSYWYGARSERETQRWAELRERFHQSAALGDPLAMASLHYCYSRGLGEIQRTIDENQAHRWAVASTLIEEPGGMTEFLLGRCYERGINVATNLETAKRLYRRSHDQRFGLGTYAFAWHEIKDAVSAQRVQDAVKQLERILEEDRIPQAAVTLGGLYGDAYGAKPGIRIDIATSARYYEKAHELGHNQGTFMLYPTYATGQTRPADRRKAESFLRQAAEAGHQMAQSALASELGHLRFYQSNFLQLARDRTECRRWLDLSAEQGFGPTCFAKAVSLVDDPEGLGYAKNLDSARESLEKAIAVNYPQALLYKSIWLSDGDGPYQKDDKESLRWARKAAATNHPRSCAFLGVLLADGVGLDLPAIERGSNTYHRLSHEALHWCMKALTLGTVLKEPVERLSAFQRDVNAEKAGTPFGPSAAVWPSEVLENWDKAFPETAKEFRRRFRLTK